MNRTRLLLAAVLVVAVLAAVWMAPIDAWLTAAGDWSKGRPAASGVLFVVFSALGAILFLPGSIIAMSAGYLYGFAAGAPLALAGLTLGAVAAFFSGRLLVREQVAGMIRGRPKLRALDRAVNERSFLIIMLTRLSVVIPYNVLNYAFGATGVRAASHATATAVGMVPAAMLWTYFGTLARSLADIRAGRVESELPSGYVLLFGVAVLTVLVVIVQRAASRALAEQLD